MTGKFQDGDRVEFLAGNSLGFQAVVLKIDQRGNLYVERTWQPAKGGKAVTVRQWHAPVGVDLLTRAA